MSASCDTVTNSKPGDTLFIEILIHTESQYGTEWKQTQLAYHAHVVVQEVPNNKLFTACDVTEGRW
jgi:hypothetical protein